MIEWIYADSQKIKRIAYNSEINIMYIDFKESTVDTPYKGVTEEMFKEFSQSDKIDEYFETHIEGSCEKIKLDTKNVISNNLKQLR